MQEVVEELRDPLHLPLAHPDPRHLGRAEPDSAGVLRALVAGEQVLVRDDPKVSEPFRDRLPTPLLLDAHGESVGSGEPEVGGEHVEPPVVEGLGEGAGVRDGLPRVVAAELEVLGEADREGGHRVQVVVARDAGEGPALEFFLELGVLRVRQQDPVLRAGEGLVGGGRQDRAPLLEWVLELAARDQAQHVRSVVPSARADLLERRPEFLDRHREEEQGEPEQAGLRSDGAKDLPGSGDVDCHRLRVPGVVDRLDPPEPERTERGARDVRAVREAARPDEVARLGEGLQHREVGDGP